MTDNETSLMLHAIRYVAETSPGGASPSSVSRLADWWPKQLSDPSTRSGRSAFWARIPDKTAIPKVFVCWPTLTTSTRVTTARTGPGLPSLVSEGGSFDEGDRPGQVRHRR